MEWIVVAASGLIGWYELRRKGRSATAGLLLGLVMPVVGAIVCMRIRPKLATTTAGATVDANSESISTSSATVAGGGSVRTGLEKPILQIVADSFTTQEVSGESHHLKEIAAVLGGTSSDTEVEKDALLIPDPANMFDPNAIKVLIDGFHVGFIPREDTDRIRPLLDYAETKGALVAARARVWSGIPAWGDEHAASISLYLPFDVATAIPVNTVPANGVVWPNGNTLQLGDETEHLPAINDLLALAYVPGSCAAFLELQVTLNDKGRYIVTAANSGQAIGRLSAVSAQKYGQFIMKISETRPCYGLARLNGNGIAAEASLSLCSPEQLDTDAIRELGL